MPIFLAHWSQTSKLYTYVHDEFKFLFADEFKNTYASKHRSQKLQTTPDFERSDSTPPPPAMAKMLSSPDMIKSVTRTLTPPVSPYHSSNIQPSLRFETSGTRVSPPSSTASSASVASHAMPISDPLIDLHWPGRPKRNSFGDTTNAANNVSNVTDLSKRRQVSPPIKANLPSTSITTTPSPGK